MNNLEIYQKKKYLKYKKKYLQLQKNKFSNKNHIGGIANYEIEFDEMKTITINTGEHKGKKGIIIKFWYCLPNSQEPVCKDYLHETNPVTICQVRVLDESNSNIIINLKLTEISPKVNNFVMIKSGEYADKYGLITDEWDSCSENIEVRCSDNERNTMSTFKVFKVIIYNDSETVIALNFKESELSLFLTDFQKDDYVYCSYCYHEFQRKIYQIKKLKLGWNNMNKASEINFKSANNGDIPQQNVELSTPFYKREDLIQIDPYGKDVSETNKKKWLKFWKQHGKITSISRGNTPKTYKIWINGCLEFDVGEDEQLFSFHIFEIIPKYVKCPTK